MQTVSQEKIMEVKKCITGFAAGCATGVLAIGGYRFYHAKKSSDIAAAKLKAVKKLVYPLGSLETIEYSTKLIVAIDDNENSCCCFRINTGNRVIDCASFLSHTEIIKTQEETDRVEILDYFNENDELIEQHVMIFITEGRTRIDSSYDIPAGTKHLGGAFSAAEIKKLADINRKLVSRVQLGDQVILGREPKVWPCYHMLYTNKWDCPGYGKDTDI